MGQQTIYQLSKFYRAIFWIGLIVFGTFFVAFLVSSALEPELHQPMIFGICFFGFGGFAAFYGWFALAITREVEITEEAIELRSKLKTKRILWKDVSEMFPAEAPAVGYVIRTQTGKFTVDISGMRDGVQMLNHLAEFAKPATLEFRITWVPLRDTIYAKVMAPMLVLLAALPFCVLFLDKDGRNPYVYAACAGAAAFVTNFLVPNVRKHSLDEEGVTVPTIFGYRRMLWRDVRKVEFGGREGSFYSGAVQRRALVLWGRGWPVTLLPGTPHYREVRAMIFTKVPPSALPREDAPL